MDKKFDENLLNNIFNITNFIEEIANNIHTRLLFKIRNIFINNNNTIKLNELMGAIDENN
jgi:hypothetical protein